MDAQGEADVEPLVDWWLYVDESGTPSSGRVDQDPGGFSVGLLIAPKAVEASSVESALLRLREDQDSDGNRQDRGTLSRKMFHASADSKNAHSHWCREIAAKVNGIFETLTLRTDGPKANDELRTDGRFVHRHLIELVAMKIVLHPSRKVRLVVARRDRSMARGTEKAWRDEFTISVLRSLASKPQIPAFFPDIDVRIVEATDPGIQAVDFLLWSVLRAKASQRVPSRSWMDRCGLREVWHWTCAALEGYEFEIGVCPAAFERGLVDPSKGKRPEDGFSTDQLLRYLVGLERSIHQLARGGVPDRAAHLAGEVHAMSNELAKKSMHGELFLRFVRLGLKLIDTAPLYDVEDETEVHRAIDAKTICGLVFLQQDVRWLSITRWWCSVREGIRSEQPQFLGLAEGSGR